MIAGAGFFLVLIGSTMLDGSAWVMAAVMCAVGAGMILLGGRRLKWTV